MSATSLQTVPDVIQAKKFEVVNDEGKVVAVLRSGEYGGFFGIFNKDGKGVAGLFAFEDASVLSIRNKDGKVVVELP